MLLKRIKTKMTEENGVSIILVAILLLVLLGFGAMAIDTGQILWTKEALQNAVDAAALAGAHELPDNIAASETLEICSEVPKTPSTAESIACNYGTTNFPGIDESNITVKITKQFNNNDLIIVTASQNSPATLRKAIGAGDTTVNATAQGIVAPSVDMCDLWPLGITAIWNKNLQYGVEYKLPVLKGTDKKLREETGLTPGNFGGLDLDGEHGGGTNDYKDRIKGKGCITSMDILPETGGMGENTFKAIMSDSDSIIQQCQPRPGYTYTMDDWTNGRIQNCVNLSKNPPESTGVCMGGGPDGQPVTVPSSARVGIIPVITEFHQGQSEKIHIQSFQAFYLTGLEGNDSQPIIKGAFLSKVEVTGGTALYGQPLGSLRGYFLWK